MTIYIEYVVLDNMVIDSLILTLCQTALKLKTSKTKIFLSALLGTITALLCPILPSIINMLIKIPLAILMVLIAFCPKSTKQFLVQLSAFLLFTFALVGACLAFCEIFGIKFLIKNGGLYEYKFPVGFALLVCWITFVVVKNILCYIFKAHNYDDLIFKTQIVQNNQKICATAFLDTGNKLEYNQKPISIINYQIFSKLYPKIAPTDILLKKNLPIKKFCYYTVCGIAKTSQILVFEVDELCINYKTGTQCKSIKISNALLGLSLQNFSKKTNSDMIISKNILGG